VSAELTSRLLRTPWNGRTYADGVKFTATATIGNDGNTAWEARCVDVPRLHRFVWRWSGGPYVEVHDGDGNGAFEAHNVWDYETDRPTIEVSADGLTGYLAGRFSDTAEVDALEHAYGASLY